MQHTESALDRTGRADSLPTQPFLQGKDTRESWKSKHRKKMSLSFLNWTFFLECSVFQYVQDLRTFHHNKIFAETRKSESREVVKGEKVEIIFKMRHTNVTEKAHSFNITAYKRSNIQIWFPMSHFQWFGNAKLPQCTNYLTINF